MNSLKFQTVERESFFSRLDFRSKLALMAVLSVVAFLWENPIYQMVMTGLIISTCLLSGIKWKYIQTILVIMLPFYSFLLLTHAFFNHDQVMNLLRKEQLTPIFTFPENWWLVGGVYPTWEGFWYGVNILFKTLNLTLVIPLGIFTTDLDRMMVSLLQIHVPYKIIFIFSSTIRFFPLLIEEFNTIIEAQKLRGVALERMRLFKRVQAYAKVAVPLILGAFVKSQQLEVVLQSKGFSGSSDRTYLHDVQLTPADKILLILSAAFLVLVIYLRITINFGAFVTSF
jgi:energy-coupling factor transport system permease protein